MSIQERVRLQQFKILKRIMIANLLLAEGQTYRFTIDEPLADTDFTEDQQRVYMGSLVRQGVITIVRKSYSNDIILDALSQSPLFSNSLPIAYSISVVEPSFSEMYHEFEGKCEEVDSTDDRWLVCKQEKLRIFYRLGCCYVNGSKEPFIKMQKGMNPRKIWDYAFENKKLHISASELAKLFKSKTTVQVSDSICKTHRGYFLKNLKKFCKKNGISIPDGMSERWLRLVNGELRIFE